MSYSGSPVREGLSVVFAVVATIALVGIIILGGWQAGWWFRAQDTNRQAQLDKQGVGYQLPLQTQIGDEIGQVQGLNTQLVAASGKPDLIGVLAAQRRGTVGQVCRQAQQVNPATPLGAEQAEFVAQNCYAGSIKVGSPYN